MPKTKTRKTARKKTARKRTASKPAPLNAFYAQSGGVTAVINASAAGVIETARKNKNRIGKVYAGRNGIIGALTEDLIDTSRDSAAAIRGLRHTPSGAFGSCRYKLKSLEQNRREYERLIEVFKAHNIGYFFYNGGGDSADTCLKVSQLSETMGYPIKAIHVPKTVDNDLPITDNCPGFGSVAKYIAVSTREAKFLKRVDAMVKKHGYCTVVVSEGVRWPEGRFLADTGLKDAFGHAQLGGAATVIAGMVQNELKLKNHWAVADYLQRAARHIASKTDVDMAYAMGKAAVQFALKGHNSVMPTVDRISNKPFKWKVGMAPLNKVANVEKMMPKNFITADGYGITQKCRDYLEPLIKGEDYPPYRDGMPQYVRLKNVAVKKKLGKFSL
ncbi:MAG: 6-phosphofructokinase [Acidiferrobacteraceae bacterium]